MSDVTRWRKKAQFSKATAHDQSWRNPAGRTGASHRRLIGSSEPAGQTRDTGAGHWSRSETVVPIGPSDAKRSAPLRRAK
jgi:hypothetical protein